MSEVKKNYEDLLKSLNEAEALVCKLRGEVANFKDGYVYYIQIKRYGSTIHSYPNNRFKAMEVRNNYVGGDIGVIQIMKTDNPSLNPVDKLPEWDRSIPLIPEEEYWVKTTKEELYNSYQENIQ